jgi:hypothetical protein
VNLIKKKRKLKFVFFMVYGSRGIIVEIYVLSVAQTTNPGHGSSPGKVLFKVCDTDRDEKICFLILG